MSQRRRPLQICQKQKFFYWVNTCFEPWKMCGKKSVNWNKFFSLQKKWALLLAISRNVLKARVIVWLTLFISLTELKVSGLSESRLRHWVVMVRWGMLGMSVVSFCALRLACSKFPYINIRLWRSALSVLNVSVPYVAALGYNVKEFME